MTARRWKDPDDDFDESGGHDGRGYGGDPEGPSEDDLRDLGDANDEPDIIPCPLCGKGIIDGADWCPYCKRSVIRPTHNRTWVILTALAILALIAYCIISVLQGNSPL